MKKILFAALALVALNACVKDEMNPDALVPEKEPEVVYDYSQLVLNELYGAGEDNEKFIEIYNKGTQEIDLEGVVLHKDEEQCWVGKKGMKVPAKGVYAVVGAKDTTPDGFSSGFSAKKSVIVELYAPEAKGGAKLDTFQRGEKGSAWGDQGLDNNKGSWSRIPDGTGAFMMTPTATPGALNNGEGATVDPTLVGNGAAPEPEVVPGTAVLNELSGAGEDNEKFFELYNPGDEAFDLEGVTINKDEELSWTGQAGQSIPAKGFFAIVGAKGTTPEGFSSGFSAKKTVIVELFDADGNKLDTFQRGDKGEGWGETIDNNPGSWSRIPDGTGAFKMTPNATPGAANNGEDATDDELVK